MGIHKTVAGSGSLRAGLLAGLLLAMALPGSAAAVPLTPRNAAKAPAASPTVCDGSGLGEAYEYTASSNSTNHCSGTMAWPYEGWSGVTGSISAPHTREITSPIATITTNEAEAYVQMGMYYGGMIRTGWYQGTRKDGSGQLHVAYSPKAFIEWDVPVAGGMGGNCAGGTQMCTFIDQDQLPSGAHAGGASYTISYYGGTTGIWGVAVPGMTSYLMSPAFIYRYDGRPGYVGNSGGAEVGFHFETAGTTQTPFYVYFGADASGLELKAGSSWSKWVTTTGIWDQRCSRDPWTVLSNSYNFYTFWVKAGTGQGLTNC